MLNLNIKRLPLLIVSSPRTGSTELVNQIIQRTPYQAVSFVEPDYYGIERVKKFENYASNYNNYILKVHAGNLKHYKSSLVDYLLYSSEVFRIKIQRKNIIDQIASYYVAAYCKNKAWHYTSNTEIDTEAELDLDAIDSSINIIKYCNTVLNNLNNPFDLELFYEDILPFDNAKYVITPKPKNYSELLEIIKDRLCCPIVKD